MCSMQPAADDAMYSSSDDWGLMYDSDAGVMEAVRELYSLRQSNVDLLNTLSTAQACLRARLDEQFEESRATPPPEDDGPALGELQQRQSRALHSDVTCNASIVHRQRASVDNFAATGNSSGRMRTSVSNSAAQPAVQRALHTSHPSSNLSKPPPPPHSLHKSPSKARAHTSAPPPPPEDSVGLWSGLFVSQEGGPSPLPSGSSLFAFNDHRPSRSMLPALHLHLSDACPDDLGPHDAPFNDSLRVRTPAASPQPHTQTLPRYLCSSSPPRCTSPVKGSGVLVNSSCMGKGMRIEHASL